jgi:ketosteroid isomerase-like protein
MNFATSSPDEAAGADFVARFTAVWQRPDPDALAALLTPSASASAPLTPDAKGSARIRQVFADALRLMPDMRAHVHDWAPHQDGVFIEFTLSASLAGRKLEWDVVDRFALDGRLASERASYFDSLPLLSLALRTPRAWPGLLRARALPRAGAVAAAEPCALPRDDATDGVERFVARFAAYWARPTPEGFLGLLADGPLDIDLPFLARLYAREDAPAAVERRLKLAPALTAKPIRWGARENSVFIELQFLLPAGQKTVRWNSVNRFALREDRAFEGRAYDDKLARLQKIAVHPQLLLDLLRAVVR